MNELDITKARERKFLLKMKIEIDFDYKVMLWILQSIFIGPRIWESIRCFSKT
jgi:hypothetical protein